MLQDSNRLARFATFFKGYMGVMPLATAAFAPILTLVRAIPIFESQRTTIATYSGLLGFLTVAWVFYARAEFAAAFIAGSRPQTEATHFVFLQSRRKILVFARRTALTLLPLALILLCLAFYWLYLNAIDEAINDARMRAKLAYLDILTREDVLTKWGQREAIAGGGLLQVYYLGGFLFAELAFVIMALREYVYGVLEIPEPTILNPPEIQ